ncbi:MAG: hypothetical protein VX438_05265 [Planctomycetota bacterium]|nr:hypothetical protein [Planctomycetota bacterium]
MYFRSRLLVKECSPNRLHFFLGIIVLFVDPVSYCRVSQAQEFTPFQKHDPPEFTTALIKDGTLRFTELGEALDYRTEVVEIMVPQKRTFEKPITVKVPQVIEKNGKKITTYRNETRFETVLETVLKKKKQSRQVPVKTTRMILNEVALARKEFTFRTVGGRSLEIEEAKVELSKWRPAIILRDQQVLAPYFKTILDPKTIVLIQKKRVKRVLREPETQK